MSRSVFHASSRRRSRISNFGGLLVIGIFGGRWIDGVGEGEGWEKGKGRKGEGV